MSLFYNFNESQKVEKVTMKWPCDEYFIPAGTPMSREGIANDGNAIGVLARDAEIKFPYPRSVAPLIGKQEPKGVVDYEFSIITGGFVNLTECQHGCGQSICEEAKAAMKGVCFIDEENPSLGGGGNLLETVGSDTLTWDGDTEGLDSVSFGDNSYLYLVSDKVPSLDELKKGGSATFPAINDAPTFVRFTSEDIVDASDAGMGSGFYVLNADGGSTTFGFVVYEPNATIVMAEEGNTLMVEKTGIYLPKFEGWYTSSLTINGYNEFGKKEVIKEEYLPPSVPREGMTVKSATFTNGEQAYEFLAENYKKVLTCIFTLGIAGRTVPYSIINTDVLNDVICFTVERVQSSFGVGMDGNGVVTVICDAIQFVDKETALSESSVKLGGGLYRFIDGSFQVPTEFIANENLTEEMIAEYNVSFTFYYVE